MLVLPVITDGISEMLRAAHCRQSCMDPADLFDAIIMPYVLMRSLSENTSQSAETQIASGSDNMARKSNNTKSTQSTSTPPKSTEDGNNSKPTNYKDFNQGGTNPADFLETLLESFFENCRKSTSTEQNGSNNENAKSTEPTAGSSKSSDDGNNKPKSCGSKHIDQGSMSPVDFFEALMQSVTDNFQVTSSDGNHQQTRSNEPNASNNATDDNTTVSKSTTGLAPPKSSENGGNNKPQNCSDSKRRHPCMNPADFFEALNRPHVLLQSLSDNSKQSTSAEPQKANGCNAKTCKPTGDNNTKSVEANTKSDVRLIDTTPNLCENNNNLKSSDNVTSTSTSEVDKSSKNNNENSINVAKHNLKPSEYSNENPTGNEKSGTSIEKFVIKSSDNSCVQSAEETIEETASKSRQLNNNNNIETQSFQVSLDVQQFKPEELTIKLSGESVITVEGKHEELEDENGSISRHFVRRYTIPAGYDTSKIISKLSSDGVLTILVPKIVKETCFEVPIVQTGLAANN